MAGGRPSASGPTIDCEDQWPFDFAPFEAQGKQGKRVARKRESRSLTAVRQRQATGFGMTHARKNKGTTTPG